MTSDRTPEAVADTFCVHCGGELSGGDHGGCANARTALEPPRFCGQCARRMVVQITPGGWTARCSRHGETAAPPRSAATG